MKTRRQNRASSLIATLLVLVVLSTIVVAFMQSMAVERMVARSAKNLLQSEIAAEGGINAAKSQVLDLFSRYPDAATVWQTILSGTVTNEGTVYYFRASPGVISTNAFPSKTKASAFNPTPGNAAAVQTYAWPLISGAIPVIATNLTNSFPSQLSTANSTDLNIKNWIGTAPNQAKKVLRAQWIYLTNSSGATNARYAYWVEDESFKVNVSLAGDVVRGSTSPGTNASEVPLQGILSLAQGIPTNDSSATALVNLRTALGGENLISFRTTSQAFSPSGTNSLADQLKFVATADSSALNISRDGWKRVNINSVFTNGTNDVRGQLDRFIASVTNSAPLFGQRFYRSSYSLLSMNVTNTVTPTNALVYLQKLAANVADYIDEDSQPTLVSSNASFSVFPVAAPTVALEPMGGGTTGANPAVAVGKENIPMLQEHVVQNRLISLSPAGWSGSNPGPASFQFSSDHYFEFWNMGTKDIYATTNTVPAGAVNLGASAFLKIYNQPGYSQVTPQIPEGREVNIPLGSINNLRFDAGKVTVITTDPTVNTNLIPAGANVFRAVIPNSDRLYSGQTAVTLSGTAYAVRNSTNGIIFNNSYQIVMDTRTTTRTDYETCVLLGNDKGLIESHSALAIGWRSGGGSDAMRMNLITPDRLASHPNSWRYFARGGSLLGNGSTVGPTATSGDPRTANEQMTMVIYDTTVGTDSTRYFNSLEDNDVPGNSTIGTLNTNFVNPNNWPDYTINSTTAAGAPMVVADSEMTTIGEFGNVFDPSRIAGSSSDIRYARGGGRALRLGQPEQWSSVTNHSGLWDGRRDSASRTWTAWRLADIFDTSSAETQTGLININGVRRDGGIAVKAALKGFSFEPSTPSVGSIALTDLQLNNLIGSISNRLSQALNSTNSPIFWERGEISEIPLFQAGTSLTGANMAQVIDRGREEIVRRLINMVTTKGNTFSVYAVGQAISVDASGKVKIFSTTRAKQTFKLKLSGMGGQSDDFDPTDAAEVAARFSPLTNYQAIPIWTSAE